MGTPDQLRSGHHRALISRRHCWRTAFSARFEQPSPVVQGSGQPGQTVPQATPVLRRPTLLSPSRCSPENEGDRGPYALEGEPDEDVWLYVGMELQHS